MELSIKERLRLRRLNRAIMKIQSAFGKEYAQARKEKKPPSEFDRIESREMWEVGQVRDEIEQVHTQNLMRRASRYHLPIPREGWERSEVMGFRYLSREAYVKFRSEIRDEEAQRREIARQWMSPVGGLISYLTGIAGFVTAIVALWSK